MTREEALEVLDTIPTIGDQVDALEMAIKALEVDLVRCGECKHRASGKMGKMCYGRHPDDFCSYGERRSDETD